MDEESNYEGTFFPNEVRELERLRDMANAAAKLGLVERIEDINKEVYEVAYSVYLKQSILIRDIGEVVESAKERGEEESVRVLLNYQGVLRVKQGEIAGLLNEFAEKTSEGYRED